MTVPAAVNEKQKKIKTLHCVSDEHDVREDARFVPGGVPADSVSHKNRCSTTWATQGQR